MLTTILYPDQIYGRLFFAYRQNSVYCAFKGGAFVSHTAGVKYV